MALRQTTGFVESLLRLVGLDWTVPDFSTLSRRQKTLAVDIPYRGSKGPLHLLIDGTGIKVEGEGEWNARKHGGPKRRAWRKNHLGIDEESLEIRVVEITGSHIGDAPIPTDLLGQIPEDEQIGSVTADGAYDTRKCHDAIAERGAHAFGHSLEPVAFVSSLPPRRNAKPWKTVTAGAVARNEAPRASKYLGRALWRPISAASYGCACRAVDGADTTAEAASRRNLSGHFLRKYPAGQWMHCVKLLSQRLMARDFDRQLAELEVRIAVLNGYSALGIPVTEAVEQARPGKGKPRPSADFCNRA